MEFDYLVIPYWLEHALATFQANIDDFLWSYIENTALYYLSDNPICSTHEKVFR